MMRTFKILRTNQTPLIVTGAQVAESVGVRHTVQVVRTAAGGFVLVVGDACDNWQVAYEASSLSGLLHTLRSFADEPPTPTVKALVTDRTDSPKVRQDLLEAVDVVLRIVGGHPERPRSVL